MSEREASPASRARVGARSFSRDQEAACWPPGVFQQSHAHATRGVAWRTHPVASRGCKGLQRERTTLPTSVGLCDRKTTEERHNTARARFEFSEIYMPWMAAKKKDPRKSVRTQDSIFIGRTRYWRYTAGGKSRIPDLVSRFCLSSVRSTSDGRGPVTRKRVPDREELKT